MEPIGILGWQVYMPAGEESSAQIAERAGIPRAVVEERLGLLRKRKAAPNEQVSDMALAAARPLLEQIDPLALDAVIYFGSPHKDYPVWLAAPRIQHELGASRAMAFEVAAVSAGCPIALKVARSMMLADPALRNVLLVAASKESEVVDYTNPRSRFMFNFGDGAAAVLLQRGLAANQVLETAVITDGSFHDDVKMPAGGSRLPASHRTVDERLHFMDVSDPAAMKERLTPLSGGRFLAVARQAAERSGYPADRIRFAAMLHTKRSLFAEVMAELQIPPERQVYLEEYGHISAIDPLVALDEAVRRQMLRQGDLVILLSAGTGYTWAATAVVWGRENAHTTAGGGTGAALSAQERLAGGSGAPDLGDPPASPFRLR